MPGRRAVIAWRCLDRAPTPDGRSTLSLHQRGQELVIRVDGHELMSSRRHGSEEALGEIACRGLRPGARICVAGLGMGWTLAAALREAGTDAEVCVVELSSAVVRWNRGPLAAVAGHPLDDPRCRVVEGDIADHLRGAGPPYDAILLDVDNGPEALSQPSNADLYDAAGLAAIRSRLAPGGLLAVWSAGPDAAYTRRLRAQGFSVEVRPLRSGTAGRGRRHQIWLARRAIGDRPGRA